MSIPPYLEAARDAAMLAYLRSESDDRGVRICHANNLSVYWSGADPFEAERTPAVRLPRLLGASDIAEVHQAAAGRISGGAPVVILPVGDAASVEERAAAAGAAGSAPAPPAQWQCTGGRPPLAELLRRRRATEAVCAELTDQPYDVVYSPEHVACYLHREAMFSKACPRLLLMLVDAMTGEHPGLLPTKVPLHVRCVELHAYSKGGALLDAGHRDNGSKRTLIVQLSEAASFEGGHFVTWHEGQPVLHELQAGDGVLIHSERMHNVAPVTRGVRHSLVIELWVAPDNKQDRFS